MQVLHDPQQQQQQQQQQQPQRPDTTKKVIGGIKRGASTVSPLSASDIFAVGSKAHGDAVRAKRPRTSAGTRESDVKARKILQEEADKTGRSLLALQRQFDLVFLASATSKISGEGARDELRILKSFQERIGETMASLSSVVDRRIRERGTFLGVRERVVLVFCWEALRARSEASAGAGALSDISLLVAVPLEILKVIILSFKVEFGYKNFGELSARFEQPGLPQGAKRFRYTNGKCAWTLVLPAGKRNPKGSYLRVRAGVNWTQSECEELDADTGAPGRSFTVPFKVVHPSVLPDGRVVLCPPDRSAFAVVDLPSIESTRFANLKELTDYHLVDLVNSEDVPLCARVDLRFNELYVCTRKKAQSHGNGPGIFSTFRVAQGPSPLTGFEIFSVKDGEAPFPLRDWLRGEESAGLLKSPFQFDSTVDKHSVGDLAVDSRRKQLLLTFDGVTRRLPMPGMNAGAEFPPKQESPGEAGDRAQLVFSFATFSDMGLSRHPTPVSVDVGPAGELLVACFASNSGNFRVYGGETGHTFPGQRGSQRGEMARVKSGKGELKLAIITHVSVDIRRARILVTNAVGDVLCLT